jgi:serine/threonine protein kinase/tetratricopeptide (TPR) repeat protein
MSSIRERLAIALGDRYQIEREIRSGGMAVVFLSRDPRPEVERLVAIKVLDTQFSSAHAVERFLREVRVVANFVHPNIVPLLEYHKAEDLLYYVMPYYAGGSLRDRLLREPQLPIEAAVRISCDVLAVLEYAHGQGIVHRDIKPDNILFSDDRPMVTDFGIARTLTMAGDPLTEEHAPIGTLPYMSPEQCQGGTLDGRSDIYSVGCLLYELLTGSVPFDGFSPQAIIARHLVDPVPPIRTVRPAVPVSVERAVLKALAKLPADRYASAGAFAEALRTRVSIAGEVRAESVAVLPFENLSAEPGTDYFSDGITGEIINALSHVAGLHVAAPTSSFAFRGRDVSIEEVGEKLHVATVVRGSVQRAGTHLRVRVQLNDVADGFLRWSERYDLEVREATDVFSVQDEIARAVAGRLLASVGGAVHETAASPPTKNLDAYNLYLQGRYHWAQRGLGLKKALDFFSQALARDPNYASAHAGLADCCILLAEYGAVSPGTVLPNARAAIQRALELAPDLAEAHCASGELALAFDWDWIRCARDLRRAIEISPRYAAAHYRLALYLSLVAGEFTEAATHARRAVELDPLAPLPHAQLGVVLMAAGRYEEAIATLEHATELVPVMLVPYLSLGVLYNYVGRTKEAIECLETAAAASGRQPAALTALAACYRSQGNTDQVQAIYEELSARSRGGYIQKSTLGMAAAAAGRVDEAFELLKRACDDRDYILIFSKRHLGFTALQADPRMAEIHRRIGFPE